MQSTKYRFFTVFENLSLLFRAKSDKKQGLVKNRIHIYDTKYQNNLLRIPHPYYRQKTEKVFFI